MAVVGDAFVEIKADAKNFGAEKALGKTKATFSRGGKEAGDSFSTGFSKEAGSKMLGSAKGLAKKIAVVLGGAYAVRAGIRYVDEAIKAGEEANKVTAQTEAVIKSTGGAANVTSGQIDKLTTSLSLKTGIDDEIIAKGSNLLLTFTNIRNEVGKGNDVFDQSNKVLVDMAAALGTEPAAAAIQLGKALNDPTKGIASLTRVGVTFTDQQKKQIEALQASGDIMGAQKIILAELTKEFGGSAEAQASATDKIKVAFGELQEALGKAILPAIEAIMPALLTVIDAFTPVLQLLGEQIGAIFVALAPAISSLAEFMGPIIGQIGDALLMLAPAVQPLMEAILSVVSAFTPLLPVIATVMATIAKVIAPVIDVFGQQLLPIITKFGDLIMATVVSVAPSLQALGDAFIEVFRIVGPVIYDVLESFQPLIPVIAEVAATVAGVLGDALVEIAPVIGDLVTTLGGAFGDVLLALVPAFVAIAEALAEILPVVVDVAAAFAGAFAEVLVELAPVIADLVSILAGALADTLVALAPAFITIADTIRDSAPLIGRLAKAFVKIVEAVVPILPIIADLIAQLVESLAPILPTIAEAITQVAEAFVPLIPIVVELAKAMAKGLADQVEAMVPAMLDLAMAMTELLVALLPILEPLLKLAALIIEKIGVTVLVKIAEAFAMIATVLAKITTAIAGVVNAIVKWDWSQIPEKAGKAVDAVLGFFRDLPGNVIEFVSGLPEKIGAVWTTITDNVKELPGKIATAATDMFGDLLTQAEELPGKFLEFIGGLPDKMYDVGVLLAEKAGEAGGDLWDALVGAIGDLVGSVGDLGTAFLDALKDAWNWIIDTANTVWNGIEVSLGPLGTLGLPDDTLLALKLARGGIVQPRPGGVLANIAEAGWPEVVLSTNPAMADRNRGLLAQSGLAGQLGPYGAYMGASTTSGPSVIVEHMTIETPRDGRGHALEFIDGVRAQMFLAGADT